MKVLNESGKAKLREALENNLKLQNFENMVFDEWCYDVENSLNNGNGSSYEISKFATWHKCPFNVYFNVYNDIDFLDGEESGERFDKQFFKVGKGV